MTQNQANIVRGYYLGPNYTKVIKDENIECKDGVDCPIFHYYQYHSGLTVNYNGCTKDLTYALYGGEPCPYRSLNVDPIQMAKHVQSCHLIDSQLICNEPSAKKIQETIRHNKNKQVAPPSNDVKCLNKFLSAASEYIVSPTKCCYAKRLARPIAGDKYDIEDIICVDESVPGHLFCEEHMERAEELGWNTIRK